MALVFEKLGKSLYDFIKNNDYKGNINLWIYKILGFPIDSIRNIGFQILEGLAFIHENLKIVHTDLKVPDFLMIF